MINIAIRATYHIFCCSNRNWDSPDLMQFWFLFFSFLFFSFFFFAFGLFFFFLIIQSRQSQAAFVMICKLPIRSEIYNCTFKNTNKVSFIIIILSFVTVFAGVLFVHEPGANHAPGASVTQVNHSVHTPSTVLRIRADPSMQIFWVSVHLHWDLPLPLVIAEHDFSVFLSCSLSGASSVCAIIIIIN